VDALAGSREIVVKSLGAQFAAVHGISGATILGDGRVVVILDLLATIRVLHAHALAQAPRVLRVGPTEAEVERDRPTLVMVVDDSVTVRKVTSRLLERNGLDVATAKDGVAALRAAQREPPDIILLDIEMPEMDGYTLTAEIRSDPRMQNLHVILHTSLSGVFNQAMVKKVGADDFLAKFRPDELASRVVERIRVADGG